MIELTPEMVREAFASYGDQWRYDDVYEAVRNDRCTCCPGTMYDSVRLGCGHILCQHCIENEHICIACALAV